MNESESRREIRQQIRALQALLAELEQGAGVGETGIAGGVASGDGEDAGDYLHSLGHFAGSIAHDLNNLLVGILGNAGLALMDLSPYSPCRPLIQEVEEAAQRAAGLANQMLGFAGRFQPADVAPAAGHHPDSAWRGQGLMLVVDDELMVRSLGKRILEKFGFQVMTAEDGRQGLEIFRQHSAEIVAVLLDVTMPHLGGAETFLEMRRLQPEVKVILSSGYDEREATSREAREGLAGFLHKPYLPMDLIDKVREVLAASSEAD